MRKRNTIIAVALLGIALFAALGATVAAAGGLHLQGGTSYCGGQHAQCQYGTCSSGTCTSGSCPGSTGPGCGCGCTAGQDCVCPRAA